MDNSERARRDKEYVDRVLAGDDAAFRRLVAAYQDNVHQFVCAALGRSQAEDVAQEVFLQVWRSLPGFRGDAAFSTWLYSVARNVCRRHWRSSNAACRRAESADEAEAAKLPDGEPGLLAGLEAEERRARVLQAVESLTPALRSVLVLSHWEGMRYEDIARVLDVPVGTVKSRVHNAVAALAVRLQEGR